MAGGEASMREIGAAREETTAYWRREPKCTTDIGFDNVEVTWRGGRRDVVFLDTGNKRPRDPRYQRAEAIPRQGQGRQGQGYGTRLSGSLQKSLL